MSPKSLCWLGLAVLAIVGGGIFYWHFHKHPKVLVSLPSQVHATEPEPQAVLPIKSNRMVFNGLYIGMPLKDVPQVLQSNFPSCKIFDDRGEPLGNIGSAHDLGIEMENPKNGRGMRIIGDGSNQVFSLSFLPKTADLATGFDPNLTPQQFIEKLRSTYGLPEMVQDANGWKCTNEDKIIFSVNNKKYLSVFKPGYTPWHP
jgi:hypothetical protein